MRPPIHVTVNVRDRFANFSSSLQRLTCVCVWQSSQRWWILKSRRRNRCQTKRLWGGWELTISRYFELPTRRIKKNRETERKKPNIRNEINMLWLWWQMCSKSNNTFGRQFLGANRFELVQISNCTLNFYFIVCWSETSVFVELKSFTLITWEL